MGSEKGMSAPARLRALLRGGGVHPLPCCHDALSAKMIGQAGFDAAFISGDCIYEAVIDDWLFLDCKFRLSCCHESRS